MSPAPKIPSLTPRNAPLDALRAACMLYIVGLWHLFNYAGGHAWFYNGINNRLVILALALFTLISGYLVGRADIPPTAAGLGAFYKKRFLRIYPPFAIASGLFLAFGIAKLPAIVKGLALVAMFARPVPLTIWYVSMIVLFYLIAPVLVRLRGNVPGYIVFCSLITGALLLCGMATGTMDMRIVLYFPCFAAGIFLAPRPLPSSAWALFGLAGLTVLSLAPTLAHPSKVLEYNQVSAPLAFFGSLFVFAAVMRAGRNMKPHILVTRLSEASFFMYLLHRPVYILMQKIWFPAVAIEQALYLLLIGLPVLAIVSWAGQRGYDGLLRRWRLG